MMRLAPSIALSALLLATPALHAQGYASLTRLNGRTEGEGGASLIHFESKDDGDTTHLSLAAGISVLRYDDATGAVRLHADALLGVNRWRWTLGPIVDFEDPTKPGAGIRLSGGYAILPHATLAATFETLTAPSSAEGRSAGTHGSFGVMVRVAF